MLAVLHHLEAVLGRRWYLTLLGFVVLGVFAIEYTGLGAALYDAVNKHAVADNAAALQLATAQEHAALAQKAAAEAEAAKQVAINAAARQKAEQEEKTALAQKAASDAETAKQVALQSAARQLAEQQEKTALAAKAAAEAVTQQSVAANSDLRQQAEARRAEAEAQQAEAKAWITNGIVPDNGGGPQLRLAIKIYEQYVERSGRPVAYGSAVYARDQSMFTALMQARNQEVELNAARKETMNKREAVGGGVELSQECVGLLNGMSDFPSHAAFAANGVHCSRVVGRATLAIAEHDAEHGCSIRGGPRCTIIRSR